MAKKILIVEDDALIREALTDKLRSSGYDVILAADGQQGYDQAVSNKPDLILLDILIPVMTGIEMLEKLRQDDWGKTATVILITNTDDNNAINDSLRLGVKNYIIKSDISSEELTDLLEQTLS